MNPKSSPLGSVWRKWDIHFHTPSSYDYGQKAASNQEIVDGLLKAGVEVVAITDHHRIDTARIKELQRLGGTNLTVLPGIEFRSELGGSNSVHFIGIFPESVDVVDLWTKLSGKLEITEAGVAQQGDDKIYCPFVQTAKIVRELGGLVSVHAGKKSNSIEELKNSDYIKQIIKKDLVRDCIDIYEVGGVADIEGYVKNVFPNLDRPIPLVLCSDNHDIRNYTVKCPLWIKGDKTFESLRQTLFEPLARVEVSNEKPIAPLIQIRHVAMNFPADTELVNQSESATRSEFCFRGKTDIMFSPYLTCLIGGRGSGKSTLLNLIHEKLEPGKTTLFEENSLTPEPGTSIESCVSIDGDAEKKVVEFLQQNEIEQFATEPTRFTEAIFSRLEKLDPEGKLAAVKDELLPAMIETNEQGKRLRDHHSLVNQIAEAEKELAGKKALISSFQNEDYKAINTELGNLSKELQGLKNWRTRLENLVKELRALKAKHNVPVSENPNAYEKKFSDVLASIDTASTLSGDDPNLKAAGMREAELNEKVAVLKQKLEIFLKGRGLSSENLADVGKANERVAQIEQEAPAQKAQEKVLATEIAAFTNKRTLMGLCT